MAETIDTDVAEVVPVEPSKEPIAVVDTDVAEVIPAEPSKEPIAVVVIDSKSNVEPEKATISSMIDATLMANVKKQVEYYFSDNNFRRDKFMREKCANNKVDGTISITTLLTFSKLKAMNITEADVIVSLKDSTCVKFNADQSGLKRSEALPEVDHTVFVGGLKRNAIKDDISALRTDVESFCQKMSESKVEYSTFIHSPLKQNNYNKNKGEGDRKFSGAALVQFESVEGLTKMLKAASATGTLTIQDRKVVVMSLKDFQNLEDPQQKRRAESGCTPTPAAFVKVTGIPSGLKFRDIRKGIESFWKDENERPYMSSIGQKLEEVFLSFGNSEAATRVCKAIEDDKVTLKDVVIHARVMTKEEAENTMPVYKNNNSRSNKTIVQITNIPADESITREIIEDHLGDVWKNSTESKWFDFRRGCSKGEFHTFSPTLTDSIFEYFRCNPLTFPVKTENAEEVKSDKIIEAKEEDKEVASSEEKREKVEEVSTTDKIVVDEPKVQLVHVKRISNEELAAQELVYTKGLVLVIQDLTSTKEDNSWADVNTLKKTLQTALDADTAASSCADKRYACFVERMPTSANIRMNTSKAAEDMLKMLHEGKIVLGEQTLKNAAVMSGAEEVAYWTKVQEFRKNRFAPTDDRTSSSRGGGRGRGGRGGGRGGRGGGRGGRGGGRDKRKSSFRGGRSNQHKRRKY